MLSLNDSQNILGLSNLIIKNIFVIENITTFEVEMIRKPHKCPCCSTMTNRIHDYRLQKIKDLPSFGNKVNLLLRKRRYVSPSCHTKLPKVIAFDEFKGNAGGEKYQCIITDPENHRIIDILPTRYKVDLISYLIKFDTSHTEMFISDMWTTYRDLAKELFPNACYVIDKYHYIRQVIWAIEAVRKEVQLEFSDLRQSS